jgi:hypothetical protein
MGGAAKGMPLKARIWSLLVSVPSTAPSSVFMRSGLAAWTLVVRRESARKEAARDREDHLCINFLRGDKLITGSCR